MPLVHRLRRFKALGFMGLSVVSLACATEGPVSPGGASKDTGLAISTPAAEGIDQAALNALIDSARAQRSDALVVLRNGKVVYENYFGTKDEPIPAMSATKSIVSLAVGLLVDEGKLASIDEPVAKMLPGFANNDPQKARITYRHLLTGTSGLSPTRAPSVASVDIEKFVVATSRCVFEPGTSWQYSNNGVDLLGLLVGKLAGKQLDAYLDEKLFTPLGIGNTSWIKDTRGVPFSAGELSIRPIDLAKVGQMILDGGVWNGRRIISKAWLDQSYVQGSPIKIGYGLLWWLPVNGPLKFSLTSDLLIQWIGNGLSSVIADKLKPMVDMPFGTTSEYSAAIVARLDAIETFDLSHFLNVGDHLDPYRVVQAAPGSSYYASGALGQYLDIVFNRKLVAVRMRRATPVDNTNSVEVNGFPSFVSMVLRLVPAATP